MSHKSKECFTVQIKHALDARLAIGESKATAKKARTSSGRRESDEKIYSWNTYRAYMQHANYFARWIEEKHPKCKTLAQARRFVDDWLLERINQGKSAYTVKLEAAALAKVYGCSTKEFMKTPERIRSEIVRSRGEKVRDAHFSEAKNMDLVTFCRCTGLRRAELEKIRGDQLIRNNDGSYSVQVISGKGGRDRVPPVIGSPEEVQTVVRIMKAAGHGKVWEKIHNALDVHALRAEYATRVYRKHARPIESLRGMIMPDPDRRGKYVSVIYKCRGEYAGQVYDRAALLAASKALGHNRVSVVAEHYLWGMSNDRTRRKDRKRGRRTL